MSAFALLPLCGGKAHAIVDPEDYASLARYKWDINSQGYAQRRARNAGARKTVFVHREVVGAKPGEIVDHVNRNPLDCRKANLRIATPTQNNMNQRAPRRKKHGVRFKGVYKNRKGKTYSAKLCGKHVGNFPTEVEAAQAYNKAALAAFGEFAYLNPV